MISGSRLPSVLSLGGDTDAIAGLAISHILHLTGSGSILLDFTTTCFFCWFLLLLLGLSKGKTLEWPCDASGCEVEARDKSEGMGHSADRYGSNQYCVGCARKVELHMVFHICLIRL